MSKVPVHSAGCHFSIMIFLPFLLMSTLIFALNWQMVTWEESGILLLWQSMILFFTQICSDDIIRSLELVYTYTDTVSVRVPYWHSVSMVHTQISYFRNTSTLRDTQNQPFFDEFSEFFLLFLLKNPKLMKVLTRN